MSEELSTHAYKTMRGWHQDNAIFAGSAIIGTYTDGTCVDVYTAIRRDAKVSPQDKKLLEEFVAGLYTQFEDFINTNLSHLK